MRKLFWQISATLDGYMEGPDHDLKETAEIADPDFEDHTRLKLRKAETWSTGIAAQFYEVLSHRGLG
ncbi:MAG TPA: hypothetical protein VJ885_03060 [Thermoanaerobaculia bacterium]|jgi:hypothetical protein|nr:hypothetical protein [Thermoanaerobaculia bacterium]